MERRQEESESEEEDEEPSERKNATGDKSMVMLQTDEVLQGERDSNSKVILDSNSQVIQDSNSQVILDSNSQVIQDSNSQVIKVSNSQVIQDSNSQVIQDSNSQVIQDSNSQVIRDSNSQVIRDSNSQVIRDSNSQVIQDSNSQVILDSNSQVIQDSNSQVIRDSNSKVIRDSNSRVIQDSNSQVIQDSNSQVIRDSNSQVIRDSNSQVIRDSNGQVIRCTNFGSVLAGNAIGGNPMVMLKTDEVLQGEGDSYSQIIQDSNSQIVHYTNFGGVLAGNASGGKPLVMLQNGWVLDGEGDSNIQFIQDSNSQVIRDKKFGGVLAGNASGGNPMVMLKTDEVLQGEGDSYSKFIHDSNSQIIQDSNSQIIQDSNSQIIQDSNSQIIQDSNSQIIQDSNSQIIQDSNSQVIQDTTFGEVFVGNASGGKPMVMLQNDGVLPIEGDINSWVILDSNSRVIQHSNSQVIRDSNSQVIRDSNSRVIQDSNSQVIQDKKFGGVIAGNASGGKPMVMLQNCGLLPMEGDSNSQVIQDSNSQVIWDSNSQVIQDRNSGVIQDSNSQVIQDSNSQVIQDSNSQVIQDSNSQVIQDSNSQVIQDRNSRVIRDKNFGGVLVGNARGRKRTLSGIDSGSKPMVMLQNGGVLPIEGDSNGQVIRGTKFGEVLSDGQRRSKRKLKPRTVREEHDEIDESDVDSVVDPDYKQSTSDSDSSISEDYENRVAARNEDDSRDHLNSESESKEDDVSVVFPMLSKRIYFQGVEKNSKGNIKNKMHACFYCEKMLSNIARHLELSHKNEFDVAKILTHPKKSKERRQMWEELVNKGDFAHNIDFMDKGDGMLIPKKRCEEQYVQNLVPCQYCKAFYKKAEIWKHSKYCVAKGEEGIKNPFKYGRMLLPVKNCSAEFAKNVLNIMRDDEIRLVIQSDNRILEFGHRLYAKHGHEVHKTHYISQKLREVGRLLLETKNSAEGISCVDDLLKTKNWDIMIKSVKTVAGYDGSTHSYTTPSLALKIGHILQKCARYMYSEGSKKDDTDKMNRAESFLKLYKSDWNDDISGQALSSLVDRKYNKQLLLPVVEDVVKLNNYLNKEVRVTCKAIKDNFEPTMYARLAQMCLAMVILFNRRRSGEAERMTLKAFADADQKSGKPDAVVLSTVNEFEKKLCESHTRIEIKGKRGRKVAVLLTKEMKESIEVLISQRKKGKCFEGSSVFQTGRSHISLPWK